MSEFDEKAAEWDTPERRERAHHLGDSIREHVPLDPTMRAIDIGAGTGLLGLDLLADLGSVVLADPSKGMIEVARTKIEREGIVDASAIVFDFPATEPPPGAPFDLAVSLLALHHVEDTEATLRSVAAALAPGGWIAFIDLDEEDGSFHDPDQPGIHHHGFDGRALVATAAAAGFDDARVRIVSEVTKEDGRSYPLFLLTARTPDA
ncbi:MAG: class I SAM-dependent methyltransferase [Candidatus Limnocylindrales bacterium]